MSKKNAAVNHRPKITNRRARFDYELGDTVVVGLVLTGAETRSLRLGHGNLQGSYITVKNNELWLINATIHGTSGVLIDEVDQTRTRKILAKQKEIKKLISMKDQGYSLVPLDILTDNRYIKLRMAIGKGKRQYDKRATLKARDEKRKIQSSIKSSYKE